MPGLRRTFSDPNCAPADASPVVEDDRRLPPAQPGQDYMSAQAIWPGQALFDAGPQAQVPMYPNFNSPYSYNAFNAFNAPAPAPAPVPGLGLNFMDYGVNDLFLTSSAADVYAAAPATHHGGPEPVPTPIMTASGGGGGGAVSAPAPLQLSRSFANWFNSLGEPQPDCIDPSQLGGGVPELDFDAFLSHDGSSWLDAPVAEDPVPDHFELEVPPGVTAYDQEPGLDSEPEDTLVPSPASARNTTPLPDDLKTTTVIKDKRGKKRPSASGDPKRTTKRRRSSSSSASSSVNDDDEFVDVSSEPEAEDDEEYRPATSRAGRPIRGVRRASAKRAALVVSDDETEEQARGRTCGDCGQKFARAAERVRHQQASTCKTKIKNQCPVCHSRITPRNDALRRHQLRTKKCIVVQDSMSRAQLDALGCVTLEEREKDAKSQGAMKQAGLKK